MAGLQTLFVLDELFPVLSAPGVRIANFMTALPKGSYIAVGGATGEVVPPSYSLTLPRPSERDPVAFSSFLFRLGARAVLEARRHRPHTVVLSVPKYELLLFAPALSRFARYLILDVRDSLAFLDYGAYLQHFLWAPIARPAGQSIKQVISMLHRRALRAADIVTAANEGIARSIEHTRVRVLSNGVDTDLFAPSADRQVYDGKRRLRLAYVGNFAEKDRFEYLFELGPELLPRIEVHLVGDGRNKAAILEQLHARGASCVDHGRRPHDQLPAIIGATDLGFIFRDRGVQESIPVCLYELSAMGVPACCNRVGLMGDFVATKNLGFVVNEPVEFVKLIRRLLADPGELTSPLHLRQTAIEEFSLKRTAERFAETISELDGLTRRP